MLCTHSATASECARAYAMWRSCTDRVWQAAKRHSVLPQTMRWAWVASFLTYPLTVVPVALSLQYTTAASLTGPDTVDNAGLPVRRQSRRANTPERFDKWDALRFGRGRLPRIDDELVNLEWGEVRTARAQR